MAVAVAPDGGVPGAAEGAAASAAAAAGAPDDGSVTVHDQVVRYQEVGAAVPPELLAAPHLVHLHTDHHHASSGHASPHAPPGVGGVVSEPDARYSDVLNEAMRAADGGVRDLRGMYASPLYFSVPPFPPSGEASPLRPALLFPAGKRGVMLILKDGSSSPTNTCTHRPQP